MRLCLHGASIQISADPSLKILHRRIALFELEHSYGHLEILTEKTLSQKHIQSLSNQIHSLVHMWKSSFSIGNVSTCIRSVDYSLLLDSNVACNTLHLPFR